MSDLIDFEKKLAAKADEEARKGCPCPACTLGRIARGENPNPSGPGWEKWKREKKKRERRRSRQLIARAASTMLLRFGAIVAISYATGSGIAGLAVVAFWFAHEMESHWGEP